MNQLSRIGNKRIQKNCKRRLTKYLKTKMMIQISQINHALAIVLQNVNVLKTLYQKREQKLNCKINFNSFSETKKRRKHKDITPFYE